MIKLDSMAVSMVFLYRHDSASLDLYPTSALVLHVCTLILILISMAEVAALRRFKVCT